MFHVKQGLDDALGRYRKLVETYHLSLDLMSEAGLASLDVKLADAQHYAETIRSLGHGTARILDVGSGVGLPGVVIALALPHSAVLLVERRKRRCAFLRLVVAHLNITNAVVYQADVSDLELEPVAVVTAQAVGRFDALYCLTRHLHAPRLLLLSRKGRDWPQEVEQLERRLEIKAEARETASLSSHGRLVAVNLPGGQRCPS